MSDVGICRGCGMKTHILTLSDQTCLMCQEKGVLYDPAKRVVVARVSGVSRRFELVREILSVPFILYEMFFYGVLGDLKFKKRNRIAQNRRGNLATVTRESEQPGIGQDTNQRVDTEES